jgi:hypothetical protein
MRRQPAARTTPASDVLRPLAVLALLALVAVGVSAARHAPATAGVGVHGGGAVVVTLGIVLLALAGAMTLGRLPFLFRNARRRRRGDDDEIEIIPERNETVWQRLGALLMLLLMVAVAGGLVFAVWHLQLTPTAHTQPGGGAHASVPATTPTRRAPTPHDNTSGAAIGLAVGAALVVIAVGGYLAVRALRRRERPEFDIEPDREPGAVEALRSAAVALGQPADPRAAILACYAAMERRLADAGTSRRVADTPEELLDRAARSGLLVPEAARRLAALFREARFSTHPMTEEHRTDAQAALGAVARTVGRHR